MAQELQPYQKPSTTLSIEQEAAKSKEILRWSTSRRDALDQGKRLVGSWPHAKPGDPVQYAQAIAETLAKYPLGIVKECCDPSSGLAAEREFPPTVACIVEYCERRMKFHTGMTKWADYEAKKQREAAVPRTDANGVPWIERLRQFLRLKPA